MVCVSLWVCLDTVCERHCKVPGLGVRALGWDGECEGISMSREGGSILSGEFA